MVNTETNDQLNLENSRYSAIQTRNIPVNAFFIMKNQNVMAILARVSVLFLALTGVLASTTAVAETLMGRVVGVADGDTITVLDDSFKQHKIRLSGIDAPEKTQAFGARSKQNLSGLVYNKRVLADCPKTDRYQRKLCTVVLNGSNINLAQVKAGLAWHYVAYMRDQSLQDQKSYAKAEENARTQGSGLWSDPRPTAPWSFRKQSRS